MGKSSPPKVHRYRMQFKATAVRLSELPDILIQDVAQALDIHPFMLSRWRKQAREGLIVTKGIKLDDETTAELKRLRASSLLMVDSLRSSTLAISLCLCPAVFKA